MQRDVEKSEQAEHAAEANEFGKIEDSAKRCDREREDEEAESPVAGLMLEEFDGICGEIVVKTAPDEYQQRNARKKKDESLGPFPSKKFPHSREPSVELFQVHTIVERCDFISVTVEHKSFVHENFTEAALGSLAPARVIDVRIHVGVETVFVWSLAIPRGGRFRRLQTDFHDGLDAFVAVLPGNDHAHRGAVLIGKSFAVHTDAKQREGMQGFVETKAFDVGIVEAGVVRVWHLLGVVKSLESHVFGFGQRLDEFENGAERIANPRNDDRPAFDAAVAINAFFEWSELENFVHGKFSRSFHLAFDGDAPGRRAEILRVFRGVALVGAEFVEIVVVGDVVFGSDFFVDSVIAFYSSQFGVRLNGAGVREDRGEVFADDGGGSSDAEATQKIAAVDVEILRRNVGAGEFKLALHGHVYCLELVAAAASCLSLIEYTRPAALDAEKAARFPGVAARVV